MQLDISKKTISLDDPALSALVSDEFLQALALCCGKVSDDEIAALSTYELANLSQEVQGFVLDHNFSDRWSILESEDKFNEVTEKLSKMIIDRIPTATDDELNFLMGCQPYEESKEPCEWIDFPYGVSKAAEEEYEKRHPGCDSCD